MKKFTSFIFACIIGLASNAQNTYNFETTGNAYIWNDLSNNGNPPYVIANPEKEGINTSDSVLYFPIQQIGDPWAGTWSAVDKYKVSENGMLQLKIFKPTISNVGFKIEANAGNGDTGATTELKVPNTKVNEWEVLEFDYSAEVGNTFSVLAIFPDFVEGSRAENVDIYVDDILLWELAPVVPSYPHLNFETSGNTYVWNDLANNDNPPLVIANPVKGGINTSDSVLYLPIKKDSDPWAGTWSAVDQYKVSESGLIQLKVFKPTISDIAFKVEANAGNGDTGATTELKVPNTKINEWEVIEYDYTAQADKSFSVLAILPDFVEGGRADDVDVYVDDVEFWKLAPVVDDYPVLDFETTGNDYEWVELANQGVAATTVENPVKGGINTSDHVLHIPVQKDSDPWAGTWSAGDRYKVSESGMVHLKVYKPTISDVAFKVEANAGNGDTGATTELKVANTLTNEWELMEFDYTAQAGKSFSVLAVMPDFVEGGRAENVDVYVDDIEFWKLAPVIEDYPVLDFETLGNDFDWIDLANGDNPPSVIANPVKGGLNSSDSVLHFSIQQGSDPWAGSWTSSKRYEVNESGLLHLMVYKPNISDVGFKLEANSGNGDTGGTTELKVPNTKVNEWEVLEYDYTAQIGNTFSVLAIMPDFSDSREENIEIYVDNIEFWALATSFKQYENSTIKIYTLQNRVAFRGVDFIEDVWIYDRAGRLVKKYLNQQVREIDINDLNSGMYIVKAKAGNMVTSAKIIKN